MGTFPQIVLCLSLFSLEERALDIEFLFGIVQSHLLIVIILL